MSTDDGAHRLARKRKDVVRRVSYLRAGRLVPVTAKGLRARCVILKPGQVMDWHSTLNREELLLGVRGQLQVEIRSAQAALHRLSLRAGSSLFLPKHTWHRVVNRSRTLASYLYITSPTR